MLRVAKHPANAHLKPHLVSANTTRAVQFEPVQDVADGVSSLLLGRIASIQQPLALVGGNCSIQGFDATGAERQEIRSYVRNRGLFPCDKNEDRLGKRRVQSQMQHEIPQNSQKHVLACARAVKQ